MTDTRIQRDFFSRPGWMRVPLQAWSIVLLGAFLLAVPIIRSSEHNETGSTERVEVVSLVNRVVTIKRTALHGRREVIVFTSSIQARLGRERWFEPALLTGHRLPNGLMAPMTC